ncbi:MAG: hypothetical protein ACFBSD_12625 [Paracoccaceae bacterium]
MTETPTRRLPAAARALATILGVLTGLGGSAGPAAADPIELRLGASEIGSLAGGPALYGAEDLGAGRIALTLEYANACYADHGAQILAGRAPDGTAHLVVRAAPADRACIEIYEPTRRKRVVRLPDAPVGLTLTIVARPGRSRPVERLPLGADTRAPDAEEAARPLAGDGRILPRFAPRRIVRTGPAGYRVEGEITLAAGCSTAEIRASVTEVPDADGTPALDLILLSAPNRCAGEIRRDVRLWVETPQPNAGRALQLPNAPDPGPHPLG